jgi:hypothetical protein
MSLSFLLGLFTGSMFMSHTFLVLLNLTTNEQIKRRKRNNSQNELENPFKNKNLCSNAINILCSNIPVKYAKKTILTN